MKEVSPKPKRRGKANSGSRQNVPARSNQAAGSVPATPQAQATSSASPRPVPSFRAAGALKAPPKLDYVKRDLKRISVTAASIVVMIIILALVLPK